MSEENVQRTRRAYDVFNERDRDAFVALMDDEVVVESRLVAVEGGYQGHEGVLRWWEDFVGMFPDYTIDLREVRDLGDITVTRFDARGHGAASATPLVDPAWHAIEWRDGKCVWWRVCTSEGEALEAVEQRGR